LSQHDRANAAGRDGSSSGESDRNSLEDFELNFHILATARQLTTACGELEQWAVKYANAHRDFKREWARAYLAAPGRTVDERKCHADQACDEFRFQNYLNEGMMQAALERVRSLRGVLSAFQTLANKQKEEMAFDRTGPH
jgi:hypothetical protein